VAKVVIVLVPEMPNVMPRIVAPANVGVLVVAIGCGVLNTTAPVLLDTIISSAVPVIEVTTPDGLALTVTAPVEPLMLMPAPATMLVTPVLLTTTCPVVGSTLIPAPLPLTLSTLVLTCPVVKLVVLLYKLVVLVVDTTPVVVVESYRLVVDIQSPYLMLN
jgi:hypothetical protein